MLLTQPLHKAIHAVFATTDELREVCTATLGFQPKDVAWGKPFNAIAVELVHSAAVQKNMLRFAEYLCERGDLPDCAALDELRETVEYLKVVVEAEDADLFVGDVPVLNRRDMRDSLGDLAGSHSGRGIFVVSGDKGTGKSFTHRFLEDRTPDGALLMRIQLENEHRGPAGVVSSIGRECAPPAGPGALPAGGALQEQPDDPSTASTHRWLQCLVRDHLVPALTTSARTPRWICFDRKADSSISEELELFVEHVAQAVVDGSLESTYLILTGLSSDKSLPDGAEPITLREELAHVTETDVDTFFRKHSRTALRLAQPDAREEAVRMVMHMAEDGHTRTASIADAVKRSLKVLGVVQ